MTAAEQEYIKYACLGALGAIKNIQTKKLASAVHTKSFSATDMANKRAIKKLVIYDKYNSYRLSEGGLIEAIQINRRNCLWELFLFEKLFIDWKEIDKTASKLQVKTSGDLAEKLVAFLGHPFYDPHGETIPNERGDLPETDGLELYDMKLNVTGKVFGYRSTSYPFFEYIKKFNLLVRKTVKVVTMIPYDNSIEAANKYTHILSKKVSLKIYVKLDDK